MHFARTMLKEEDEARQHSELREDFTAFSAGTLLPHSPRSAGSFPFQGLQLERGKQNSRDVKTIRWYSCRDISHGPKKSCHFKPYLDLHHLHPAQHILGSFLRGQNRNLTRGPTCALQKAERKIKWARSGWAGSVVHLSQRKIMPENKLYSKKHRWANGLPESRPESNNCSGSQNEAPSSGGQRNEPNTHSAPTSIFPKMLICWSLAFNG